MENKTKRDPLHEQIIKQAKAIKSSLKTKYSDFLAFIQRTWKETSLNRLARTRAIKLSFQTLKLFQSLEAKPKLRIARPFPCCTNKWLGTVHRICNRARQNANFKAV